MGMNIEKKTPDLISPFLGNSSSQRMVKKKGDLEDESSYLIFEANHSF